MTSELLPAPGRVPDGRRLYAIGDVHGCLDRLVSLHWSIAADLAARPVRESVLLHLGDYVDRGADSAGVLWLLAGDIAAPVTRRIDLIGNHEEMMTRAYAGDREMAGHWIDNGGETTLQSYGFGFPAVLDPAEWRAALPAAHSIFLRGLRYAHREGDYFFVHAGIRPGRALDRQSPRDMLWIREPFLSDVTPREAVVVHGHTPVPEPDVRPNRIGIDTGAVMGGKLTCVVLEADTLRFLHA